MNKLREKLTPKEVLVNARMRWPVIIVIFTSCVDRINFSVPSAQSLIVVEGMITDNPGPYTVKVSKSISINSDSSYRDPVQNAKIKLYDDEGNDEDFIEGSPGVYLTSGLIQGKPGHAYSIVLETQDGKVFKSIPDTINPVGEIEQIKFEYEARTIQTIYGDVDANVFKIYVDANAGTGDNNYVRWRFTGTFKVVTNPELHEAFGEGSYYKNPLPCSGYIVEPALGGGKLAQVAPCTCCTCWVNQFESEPTVSDGQLISNNRYSNVKVAEVPVNSATFSDKYMVQVEQMSLTKNAFEFFRLIRAQKNGASSLFQPPFGEIKGNVNPVNSTDPVVGLFWATSIKGKLIFTYRSDVPDQLTPMDINTGSCTSFLNSSTAKPDLWQ